MEIKEAAERRVVIAKPVACRPTCNSTFGSFSELLAGAINASPSPSSTSNLSHPSSIAAIVKPKTLRIFNPPPSQSQQAEPPTIIYRPQAKFVSKRTASLLANMVPCFDAQGRSFNQIQQQIATLTDQNPNQEAEAEAEEEEELIPCSNTAAVEAEVQQATEQLTISSSSVHQTPMAEEDSTPKAALAAGSVQVQVAYGDRPSYDGYNWRKYGQKQVKGSEYPRSYYKCTHPSCPVKKKVERSLDGQIAEIVYKGEHSHSKPSLPARRSSVAGGGGGNNNTSIERGEVCGVVGGEIRIESGLVLPNGNAAETGSNAAEIEVQGDQEDEPPRSKRRRAEDHTTSEQTGNVGEGGGRETGAEAEVLGDGFRWRKYGQKVVRGNPYPRSYYRCTNSKCKVRKYVERSLDDPNALVTTYEGKHNHDIPAA